MKMDREFANSVILHTNGKTMAVCDNCGKEHKPDYGFCIKWARRNCLGSCRISLCGKCAKNYLPTIENIIGEIHSNGFENHLKERGRL